MSSLPIVSSEASTDAPSARGEDHDRTKGLLRLTMACNERCLFCNVPVEDFRPVTPSLAALDEQLQDFIASGAQTLTISGGEPTLLRERLVAAVRKAREGGVPFVELQTNAVLIDDDYAAELASAGVTSAFVSFLSHVPALHDELAGLPGAYDDCLRGMDALVANGITVTLNPVTAYATQGLVADYVSFVAERLPAIRSISLSAVQPHGRARQDVQLLPDYGVLREQVIEAQARAAKHDIRLLNPYCGLPLCVGWDAAADRSVEAIEALEVDEQTPFGVDNHHDKRHGRPCRGCALRTRCGGAWNAYWDVRRGRGLHAPLERIEPWFPEAKAAPGQLVVATQYTPDARVDGDASIPTRWCMVTTLRAGDGARLRALGYTDVGILTTLTSLRDDISLQQELSAIGEDNAARDPQRRLRVALGLRALGPLRETAETIIGAVVACVDTVDILLARTPTLSRFVAGLRAELPPDTVLRVGGRS
ncbi:MAG: radical SAM protein [Polyangiales bacterium]|nr:radical SAM protein [Sandaracinaceae bacterium]